MPDFSVIITWRDRLELGETLRANAPFFAGHDVELVVVNCGGDPSALGALLDGCDVARVRHVVIPDVPFNKSLANNIGVSASSGSRLLFLDADILFTSDMLSEARAALDREPCVLKVRKIRESEPAPDPVRRIFALERLTHQLVLQDGRCGNLDYFTYGDGSRCGSGVLSMKRAHLLTIEGFNSALTGWGWEDQDVLLRLQFAAKLDLRAIGEMVHMTHGDEKRNLIDASRREHHRRNMHACFEHYGHGRFTGTYHEDTHRWADRLYDGPGTTSLG